MAPVLWNKKAYSRTDTLAAADRARARGRRKKAIAGYRKVLAVDPGDAVVHGKLAPLLAAAGARADALASFRAAAAVHLRTGFPERAIAVLGQAADHYPDETALWDELGRLHLQRGRRADAVVALANGGARLLRVRRPAAIRLLRNALELEPWHPAATMTLARALAAQGERGEALALLDGLAARVRGPRARAILGLAFRLAPSPRRLWRWARGRS